MKATEYEIGQFLAINSHVGEVITMNKVQFLDNKEITEIDSRFSQINNVKLEERCLKWFDFNLIFDNKIGTKIYNNDGFTVTVNANIVRHNEKIIDWVHELQSLYFIKTKTNLIYNYKS